MSEVTIVDRRVAASPHDVTALFLLLGAVLVAYGATAAAMVSIWSSSSTFAHAFIVPPIVVWLIWRKRHALAAAPRQPCPWMLLPMGALAFAWLLGDVASVGSITQLAMTGLLVLAVPVVLGLPVARVILFPLAFLFFAVPLGEFLLPQLMSWTADFTVFALRATGVPVFRQGNQITIPSGTWSVVEACSGVRYLIASLMVGTLFAYLSYRSTRRRWIFVGVSILVPIVANWVRAYVIVLLAHLSSNRIAVGVDHLIYGWIFFGVVIGLMFMIGGHWAEPEATIPPGGADVVAVPSRQRSAGGLAWATAFAATVVVILPHLALHPMGEVPSTGTVRLSSLDSLPDAGPSTSVPLAGWKPDFRQPSAESIASYEAGGRSVGVYIGYYRQQNYRRKLVSSDNSLVKSDNPAWVQVGQGRDTVEIAGDVLTVRSAVIRGVSRPGTPEQSLRVWQLYWVGDRLTVSDYWAKVYAALDRLLRHGDDAAVIVLYTSEDHAGDGRRTLESFARTNLGAIVARLRAVRDGVAGSVAASDSRSPSPGKSQ
jgi:exosortase A